jgi:hypothetical protein
MRLTWRDGIATVLVAAGVGFSLLWLAGWTPGSVTAGTVAAALLVLGVAASLSAVVPGFEELRHAPIAYLAVTSILGLVALAAGALAVLDGETLMVGVLTASTATLWVLATLRHLTVPHAPLQRPGQRA